MRITRFGPGRFAPARFVSALALAIAAAPAIGQVPQQPVAAQNVPVPDALQLAKLVWTTMAAIDHANQAGNYSVLRDLSSPAFQVNNDAARLAQVFASLRAQNVDLSDALLLGPTYTAPAAQVQPGLLRLQGYFGLRPTAIGFDLYFQWVAGRWRLFGVSITPRAIATQQPGPAAAPPPQRPAGATPRR